MTVPIPRRGSFSLWLPIAGSCPPSSLPPLDAFVTTARPSRRSDDLPTEATSFIGPRELAELRHPARPAAPELQKNRAQYIRADVVSLPFETPHLSIG